VEDSGKEEDARKGGQRAKMVEMFYIHVCEWKNVNFETRPRMWRW
jgi:hypothetical protein